MKRVAPFLAVLAVLIFGGAFVIRRAAIGAATPAVTASATTTPSMTLTATDTATFTLTPTYTASATFTSTATPTASSTLSTRVFPVVIVNSGVQQVPGLVTFVPQTQPGPTDAPTATETPSMTATQTPSVGPGTPQPSTWTVSPSSTPSLTATVSDTPSVTFTASPSATEKPTSTPSATLPPPSPATMAVPAPPVLSDLTVQRGATQGWVRYVANDPAIQWSGAWQVFGNKPNETPYRSAGNLYKYSNAKDASMSLHFHGAAVRVRYAGCSACGVFEIRIDGRVMREVDSYYSKLTDANGFFGTTEYWGLASGDHVLDVVSMNRKNPSSTDTTVAVDAIEIFRTDIPTPLPTMLVVDAAGTAHSVTVTPIPATGVPTVMITDASGRLRGATITMPPPTYMIADANGTMHPATAGPSLAPSLTPTATLGVVGPPEVVQAPPLIPPTGAPDQPVAMTVMMTVTYNQSGSGVAIPNEGVPGISVRLVDVYQNRVVASGITNSAGIVSLSVTTNHDVRVVIPYFGKVFDVGRTPFVSLSLIIPPGNVPGLIP